MDETIRPMPDRSPAHSGPVDRRRHPNTTNSSSNAAKDVDENAEFISETVTAQRESQGPASSEMSVNFDPQSNNRFGGNGIQHRVGRPGSSVYSEETIETASDFGEAPESSYETISTDGSVTIHTDSDASTDGESAEERAADNITDGYSDASDFIDHGSESDAQSKLNVDYSKNFQRILNEAEEGRTRSLHTIRFEHRDSNQAHTLAIPLGYRNGRPADFYVYSIRNGVGQCFGKSLTWLENVRDIGLEPKDAKADDHFSGWRQMKYGDHLRERDAIGSGNELDDNKSVINMMQQEGFAIGEQKFIRHEWNKDSRPKDQFIQAFEHIASGERGYLICMWRANWGESGENRSYGHTMAASSSQGRLTFYDPNHGAVSVQTNDREGINLLARHVSNECRLRMNLDGTESPISSNLVHLIQYVDKRDRVSARDGAANQTGGNDEAGPSNKRPVYEGRRDEAGPSSKARVIDEGDEGQQNSGTGQQMVSTYLIRDDKVVQARGLQARDHDRDPRNRGSVR